MDIELDGVRAGDDGPARIYRDRETGRLWIVAYNEGGHQVAGMDLGDLLKWLDEHPDIVSEARAVNS